MKNEKTQSYNRQNKTNKIELPKNKSSLSPKQDKKYKKNQSPKKKDNSSQDLLENTRKYIEMSNGNNNYIISPISPKNDISEKYTSPNLAEEYNITKKYNDIYDYNNISQSYIQDEYENENRSEEHTSELQSR